MKHSRITTAVAIAVTLACASTAAFAQNKLRINLVVQSASSNVFWQPAKRGMEDACKAYNADCQFIFVQKEGDIANHLRNFQTSVAQKVDGIAIPVVDDNAYDQPIADALKQGIEVLAFNNDDTQGSAGNKRLAYIGQSLTESGTNLAKGLEFNFPATGPIHVLVGVAQPGANWAELRAKGIIKGLEDFKARNPNRPLTYEKLDTGTDANVSSQRVAAYFEKNPKTNAFISVHWAGAVGLSQILKTKGVEPGKITIGAFDVMPALLDRIEEGYIQGTIDQQPYLQGYLPVMQIALMKLYKLSAWDVDTGSALVTKKDVAGVRDLAAKGFR